MKTIITAQLEVVIDGHFFRLGVQNTDPTSKCDGMLQELIDGLRHFDATRLIVHPANPPYFVAESLVSLCPRQQIGRRNRTALVLHGDFLSIRKNKQEIRALLQFRQPTLQHDFKAFTLELLKKQLLPFQVGKRFAFRKNGTIRMLVMGKMRNHDVSFFQHQLPFAGRTIIFFTILVFFF
jgi:hypothetical protein